MITRLRRRIADAERGAALIWVAGSMIALLAMTALSVDLGWYYLNASRLQRAADSAALAGVVHLPSFPARAIADAEDAARVNDMGSATVTGSVVGDNQYSVTLAIDVPMFFASVIGIDTLPVSSTATAEYIKPVPLGSPSNTFGDGTSATQSFWAAINGPHTAKQQGDPYATKCWSNPYPDNTWPDPEPGHDGCTVANVDYRTTGYNFGVEIPAGTPSFNVAVMNGTFYARGTLSNGTGDYALEEAYDGDPTEARFNTNFTLYEPDSTPSDPFDNTTVVCSRTFGTSYTNNPHSWDGTYWNDYNVCGSSVSPPAGGGTYVLRVTTTEVGSYDGIGTNQFRLRVDSSNSAVRIFGINDMSVYTNVSSGTSTIYLAEIDPIHAGKKLLVDLYDPGEDNGNAYFTIKPPTGAVSGNQIACDYESYREDGSLHRSGSPSNCRIKSADSGSSYFQGEWVKIEIDVPSTYTCSSDCWWKIIIENSQSHDRTVWEAKVIGNPVRLVPNP